MNSLIDNLMNFSEQPRSWQLGVLLGTAASLGLLFGIFTWVQAKPYTNLYTGFDTEKVNEVAGALDRMGVEYRVDTTSGQIMVPTDRKHAIRLRLARDGLPSAAEKGFKVLYEEQQFGVSSFLETARYNRALEEELQLSIATLDNVRAARVHLAIPKRSSFVRAPRKVNASVIVTLGAGRTLAEDQLAGIVYLVSSSVPELDPEAVTVVDHRGRLLSGRKTSKDMLAGAEHYRFAQQVEQKYVTAINEILYPLMGADNVRASVTAELNFSTVEETNQQYNPSTVAVRSESTVTENNPANVGGPVEILSDAPEEAVIAEERGEAMTVRSTRNYEVDQRISHRRESPGSVKRISVAVVVNHRETLNEEGVVERVPLSEEEMTNIRTLVREAVGFSEARGDSVIVTNSPFVAPAEIVEPEAIPLWQQPVMQDYARVLLGFIAMLVVVLKVVRPVIQRLTERQEVREGELLSVDDMLDDVENDRVSVGALAASAAAAVEFDRQMIEVRELIRENPDRVAQVVSEWVTVDA